MYLPKPPTGLGSPIEEKVQSEPLEEVTQEEIEEDKSEILRSIKEEDEEDEETLVDINEIKPKEDF